MNVVYAEHRGSTSVIENPQVASVLPIQPLLRLTLQVHTPIRVLLDQVVRKPELNNCRPSVMISSSLLINKYGVRWPQFYVLAIT